MNPELRRAGALVTLGAAVRALDGVAPVAPLKGALLELTARPGRSADAADVDILVPEERFDAAERALTAEGFLLVARDRDDRSRTFGGRYPVSLDVHRRLFKAGLFRVPTAGLFARARVDRSCFDAPIHLLDGRDAYAHAVGHAAGAPAEGAGRWLEADLAALVRHHALEAPAVAAHLRALGLRRAARFALARLGDPFSRAVLAALPADPVGAAVARLIRASVPGPAGPALGRALAVHALNDTLPRGARSLVSHLIHGSHQRITGEPPGIRAE